MLRFLIYMLRIRRVEFRIAEIPIVAIPVLLTIKDLTPVRSFEFWEGVFIFFLLFAFGDMINCLADRDLDAVYKPHLSEAVYGLGVGFVTFQVIATAVAALAISAHLSWRLDRWVLLALVAVGLVLGAAYSVKPVQLKGRGLAQLVCLWMIIFFGPMIFVAALINATPSLPVIGFAATYGLLQMGIILINTAEDYPEDLNASIRTTIVSLGLHRGITLALVLTIMGALGSVLALVAVYWQRTAALSWYAAIVPLAAAAIVVTAGIWRLHHDISGDSLESSIVKVKKAARFVPLWVTLVAWSALAAAFALFYFGKV